MASPSLRVALCALVGLFVGAVLGGLFVPDPTGPLAAVLTLTAAVIVGGWFYRSDWLRDDAS